MKVFIVEDNEQITEILTTKIEEIQGVEICGHASAEFDAVEKIALSGADVVILDIKLEEGSGIGVLTKLKIRQSSPRVYIHTNYIPEMFSGYCIGLGADKYFDKSFQTDELIDELVQTSLLPHQQGA